MDQLEKTFDKFFERLLFFVLLLAITASQNGWMHDIFARIKDPTLQGLAEHTVEFGIPIGLIGALTRAFRKWFWKLHSPELNFGGRWIGVSDYDESIEVKRGEDTGLYDEQNEGPMRPLLTVVEFEQEMSVARLVNGRAVYPAESGVRWYSSSLSIRQGPPLELQISYVLREPHKQPVNAIESITVFPSRRKFSLRHPFTRRYRYPQMLQGRFEHAWNGEARFLHRGDTYYARVTDKEFKQIIALSLQSTRSPEDIKTLANSIEAADDDEDLSGRFKDLLIKCLAQPALPPQNS